MRAFSPPASCSHPSCEGRLRLGACRKRGMTMSFARLAICLAAVLALAATAGTARSDTGAPTGLHGFLLRADEPARTSFSRTPAFAWAPVPGASHYEVQLTPSSTSRDNRDINAGGNQHTPRLPPD